MNWGTNWENKKEREYPSDETLGVPSHRDNFILSMNITTVKRILNLFDTQI